MIDLAMRRLVTYTDNARLRSLMTTPVARHNDSAMRLLLEKLNRCRMVPAERMPRSIVTMSSSIACWGDGGVGIELLGAIPGHVFRTDGVCLSIADVTYQPEAERQFHL